METGLSAEQLHAYESAGFLVIPDFFSGEASALLKRSAEEIVAKSELEAAGMFSTTRQQEHSDDWFLGSGDKVRVFREAENSPGQTSAANKLGHALHELHPVFRDFSHDPRLAAIARSLNYQSPTLLQSMFIFKGKQIGGEVRVHQDATFLYTDPPSVMGFWFAVEDATLSNGCLWALPGGHREPLRERFVRNGKGGVEFRELHPEPLPTEGYIPLEVKAGTLVLLHGLLPHYSLPNHSEISRNAYTLHIVEGTLPYPKDNWLQRSRPARVW